MWLQFIHLAVFYNIITTRIKWWFIYILLFITKGNQLYLFYIGCWYSTMAATFFISFPPIMHIYRWNLLCCSIMMIMLTLVIHIRLIIRFILFFTIIIGGFWYLEKMPITLWFNSLDRCDLCSIRLTIKKEMNRILRNKLNNWYIFQFAY